VSVDIIATKFRIIQRLLEVFVSYNSALTTLTSCNRDETLTETVFSPNQS